MLQIDLQNDKSEIISNMPAASDTVNLTCDYENSSIKEMISFIHANYTQKISLADISKSGKVCRSKCCILFKEYLHRTPLDYLTVHRLRKATELLTNTTDSIGKIAAQVGFNGT
ncbi:MAG: helix-turn-helix domain-containing protein, partial [Oscillospiraceae bacterium]|nr:helix-turn-helix domain-containing protein [Oscillospiraceae bacterium]